MSSKHFLHVVALGLGLWGAVNTCLAGFNYVAAGVLPSLPDGWLLAGPLLGSLVCLCLAGGKRVSPREAPNLPPLLNALAYLWQSSLGEDLRNLAQNLSPRGLPQQARIQLTFSEGSQYALTWSASPGPSAAKTAPSTSAGHL